MPQTKLKIGPIPDEKPVRLSVSVGKVLHSDLELYSRVYRETYGQDAALSALVPLMLEAFLASDTEFRRARKQRAAQ